MVARVALVASEKPRGQRRALTGTTCNRIATLRSAVVAATFGRTMAGRVGNGPSLPSPPSRTHHQAFRYGSQTTRCRAANDTRPTHQAFVQGVCNLWMDRRWNRVVGVAMTLREKLRATMNQPHWVRERQRAGLPSQMTVASTEDLITDVLAVIDEHYVVLMERDKHPEDRQG